MKRAFKGLFFAAAVFLITGCATSRGYLNIEVPQETAAKENGMQVYVRQINDNRQFQLRPRNPDMPSLGKKDIENESLKKRAIGRKRNGYGKALGSIFVGEDQSVESIIYEAVKNSLISMGYAVTNEKDTAKSDAIIMDIGIDQFWSWVNMGVWTLRVDAEIKTTISQPMLSKTFTVEALAQNHCQAATTANWRKAIRIAIAKYMEEFKNQMNKERI